MASKRRSRQLSPVVVYHGTQSSQLAAIRRDGLVSPMGYDSPQWYMVAADFASAAFHSNPDAPIVLTLRVPTEEKAGRFMWPGYPYLWKPTHMEWNRQPTSWFALRQPIPPAFIEEVRHLTYAQWRRFHET